MVCQHTLTDAASHDLLGRHVDCCTCHARTNRPPDGRAGNGRGPETHVYVYWRRHGYDLEKRQNRRLGLKHISIESRNRWIERDRHGCKSRGYRGYSPSKNLSGGAKYCTSPPPRK